MIRPSRLERRLDAALAPVVDRLDTIDETIGTTAAKVVEQATAKVADAEQRVTAATAQAGERVAHAERRAADAIAAVRAELREAKEQSIGDAIAMLRTDLDNAQRARDNWSRKVDELVGVNAELRDEVERLTIERDAARSAHDDARAAGQCDWILARDASRRVEALAALVEPTGEWA